MATKNTRPRNSTASKSKLTDTDVKNATSSSNNNNNKNIESVDKQEDLFTSLKRKYKSQLKSLHELFTDWNDEDLIAVLQEVQGDLEIAIVRISEGHAQQWSTLGKKSKKESANVSRKSAAEQETNMASAQKSSSTFKSNNSGSARSSSGISSGRGRGRGRGGSRPQSNRVYPEPSQTQSQQSSSYDKDSTTWGSTTSTWGSVVEKSTETWGNVVEKTVTETTTLTTRSLDKKNNPVVSATIVQKKSGTWADIAKPDLPPAPVAVVKEQVRDKSPKRQLQQQQQQLQQNASIKRQQQQQQLQQNASIKSTGGKSTPTEKLSAPQSPEKPKHQEVGSFPPGLRVKKDASVVMPSVNPSGMNSVGVKFGSLSLNSDSEAILDNKKSTPIIGGTRSLDQSSSSANSASNYYQAPSQQQPQQQTHQQQQPEYPSYEQRSTSTSTSTDIPSLPSGMPAYPPNLASMYAAYFPIYMNHLNQFGANPYAAAGAPQPHHQQHHYNQLTAAMNKGYMYPPTATTANTTTTTAGANTSTQSATTVSGNANNAQPKQQVQMQQHNPAYNAYYNMAMPMVEDDFNSHQSMYGRDHHHHQSTSNTTNTIDNKPGIQNLSGMNMAYYNQMMQAGAYPNFVQQQQQQQPSSFQQQSSLPPQSGYGDSILKRKDVRRTS